MKNLSKNPAPAPISEGRLAREQGGEHFWTGSE
jgi:hypothetical protein